MRYGLAMTYGRASMETHGSYRGIRFTHGYNPVDEWRKGEILFPEGSVCLQTRGGDAATWEDAARQRIDAHFREIDSEPDDDSEA
jgi:hypothetical protein